MNNLINDACEAKAAIVRGRALLTLAKIMSTFCIPEVVHPELSGILAAISAGLRRGPSDAALHLASVVAIYLDEKTGPGVITALLPACLESLRADASVSRVEAGFATSLLPLFVNHADSRETALTAVRAALAEYRADYVSTHTNLTQPEKAQPTRLQRKQRETEERRADDGAALASLVRAFSLLVALQPASLDFGADADLMLQFTRYSSLPARIAAGEALALFMEAQERVDSGDTRAGLLVQPAKYRARNGAGDAANGDGVGDSSDSDTDSDDDLDASTATAGDDQSGDDGFDDDDVDSLDGDVGAPDADDDELEGMSLADLDLDDAYEIIYKRLDALSREASRFIARRTRKHQRSAFRVLKHASLGNVHDQHLSFGNETLSLRTFTLQVLFSELRTLLGHGVVEHLALNPSVRDVFGLGRVLVGTTHQSLRARRASRRARHEQNEKRQRNRTQRIAAERATSTRSNGGEHLFEGDEPESD